MFRISARIVIPVLIAFICVGVLLLFIWWQLVASSALVLTPATQPVIFSTNASSSVTAYTTPSGDSGLQAIREGDIFALEGNWTEAEKAYASAVDKNGGLPALRKLAKAQLERRSFTDLQKTIILLKNNGAKEPDIVLLESIVLLRSGELTEAKQKLESAEDSPQKSYGLVLLSIAEGNHEAAKKYITEVLNGFEPVLRSNVRTIQDAYDEYALFTDGSNIHLVTLVARALSQVEECELAIPLLSQVTAQQPDYRDAWIVQGYCELFTERIDNSIHSFEKAYQLDPQKTATQYFLGRAYFRAQNYQSALTFFEYALKNGFTPASEIEEYIATTALKLNNPELAYTNYQNLLKSEPSESLYEKNIILALTLGKNSEAYELSLVMVRNYNKSAHAFLLLGKSAVATGKTQEAKQAFQTVINFDPTNTEALTALKELN